MPPETYVFPLFGITSQEFYHSENKSLTDMFPENIQDPSHDEHLSSQHLEVEATRPRLQGLLQLRGKFSAILGYVRPWSSHLRTKIQILRSFIDFILSQLFSGTDSLITHLRDG